MVSKELLAGVKQEYKIHKEYENWVLIYINWVNFLLVSQPPWSYGEYWFWSDENAESVLWLYLILAELYMTQGIMS
jgi:hypothetical protein